MRCIARSHAIESLVFGLEHPLPTIALVLGTFLLGLWAVAQANLPAAWRSMWRLCGAFFEVPFRRLQDIAQMLLRYDADERRYRHTHGYALHKTCPFMNVGILVAALGSLAGGIAAAGYSLVPEDQLQSRQTIASQLSDASKALTEARAEAALASGLDARNKAAATAARDEQVAQLLEAERDRLFDAMDPSLAETKVTVQSNLTRVLRVDGAAPRTVTQHQMDRILSGVDIGAAGVAAVRAYMSAYATAAVARRTAVASRGALVSRISAADERRTRAEAHVGELQRQFDALSWPHLIGEAVAVERLMVAGQLLLYAALAAVGLIWVGGVTVDVATWMVAVMALERPVGRAEPAVVADETGEALRI